MLLTFKPWGPTRPGGPASPMPIPPCNTYCHNSMIQILYLWNKLNKQQLLTLSPLGPGGPCAPWQEIKQYCKIIHNAFFEKIIVLQYCCPPMCIKCTCILCKCYCSFLLFRWRHIPSVLVCNPSGLTVIAVTFHVTSRMMDNLNLTDQRRLQWTLSDRRAQDFNQSVIKRWLIKAKLNNWLWSERAWQWHNCFFHIWLNA